MFDLEDSGRGGELEEVVAIVLLLPLESTIDRDLSLDPFWRNLGNFELDGDDGEGELRSYLDIDGRRRDR